MKPKNIMLILMLALIPVVLVSGCTADQPIVGGDKDEHGCIPSAGYTWCEAKQKCLRTWEESCEDAENITNFDECIAAGYPAMESYPRQCMVPDGRTFVENITITNMTYEEAKAIAENSSCMENGTLKETYMYNANTGTWWLDLDIDRPDCAPACVVNVVTWEAEINWRCTGAFPPL